MGRHDSASEISEKEEIQDSFANLADIKIEMPLQQSRLTGLEAIQDQHEYQEMLNQLVVDIFSYFTSRVSFDCESANDLVA